MSRSRRKPFCVDSSRSNKWWKRRANKVFRKAEEVLGGNFFKKVYCCWDWCDYRFYDPDDKKVRRK